jgi:hypothetical protein
MTPTQQIIERLRVELTMAANIDRQTMAQKLLDYYAGKQLEHLDEVLSEQFSEPDSLKLQPAIDNLTQFIADEISRVCDQPPTIASDDSGAQKFLKELTGDGLFALALKTAEVYANLTGVCGLHPWWDSVSNKLKTAIIPCSVLWVVQRDDDPTEPEAVIYKRELKDTVTAQSTTEYVRWDKDGVFVFDSNGVVRPPSDDNPDMVNPYEILPFAWLRDSFPVNTFFPDIDESLINQQDTLNVLLTSANQLAKYQGFSQPVMIGIDQKSNVVVDPSKPIRIPPAMRDETQPDFKFVTPDSKIGDILEQIRDHVERACARRGISMTALKSGAESMSGYAMKLANAKLERRRVDQIPLVRSALLSWWEIAKKIANAHKPGTVNPGAAIKIDFAEPDYEDDPQTELTRDEKEIALGLSSPVKVLMRRNPDLTEEAAKAEYEQNLEYRKSMKSRFGLADILGGGQSAQ